MSETPQTIRLTDYQPPAYTIDHVDLYFTLDPDTTRVTSRLSVRRLHGDEALLLDGHDLDLISVAVDGRTLGSDEYRLDDHSLGLDGLPDNCELEIVTEIHPAANTSLGGLYTSGGNFCTQCEAEEFRKITYYLDRPDVMARFTTTLEADKAGYPVLLSNGNLIASGELDSGRHWAKWEDPFPKPSYLFALVAGDLARIEDTFTTLSGRNVALHIYVQHHNIDKCEHAMRSLQKAMRWDEKTYGREYDLDLYMIIAVDDFNMGAMENKGLNVFNSRYVLARPDTATDADYLGIESVIAHEYFHNWSGNRVTCRDWFQLSLKEGFTVFRDQEFSADMNSRGVQRIGDINVLRTHQFREDAGPMAHPVRPDAYVEINNFYTVTVYNKGAEVVRMLAHLVGPEGFRRGTDLYFERHDGQAVTTDDFVKAIEHANRIDFSQFRLWYSQAGTPELHISHRYDVAARTLTLDITQTCPPTPDQPEKQPFHIPLAVGLLDAEGCDLPLCLEGEAGGVSAATTRVLHLREASQSFVFRDLPAGTVPSLLRGFSAPVKWQDDLSDSQRYFLMAHDSDPFSRWEAGQKMAVKTLMGLVDDIQAGRPLLLNEAFAGAFARTLADDRLDPAFAALALGLPVENYLAEFMQPIDPQAIHAARDFLRRSLAERLRPQLEAVYAENAGSGEYRIDGESIGRRALKNACLGYLSRIGDEAAIALAERQFNATGNMTDSMAALTCLANQAGEARERALSAFYQRWRDEPLVVDKWLGIQATASLPDTLARVRALTEHEAFTLKNPNKVRALIGAFANTNPACFHTADGDGYVFLADHILKLDALNPQVAARLTTPFTQWRKYDEKRQALMQAQLQRLLAESGLSKDVFEVVSKSLQAV
ncbi:MAG TPA: aminopeptidase N [Gammaproteobacteria bacterium]|nr:aminopeptidase N [Gammaproteobacteria bacterium]